MSYQIKLSQRKQIIDLIEWIADGINDQDQGAGGYQFLNVSADSFDRDSNMFRVWTWLTAAENRFFVSQILYDINIGTEEGIQYDETVFYNKSAKII